MNYYHEFSVGFNWWYVVAPLLVIVIMMFGTTKYKLDEESLTVLKRGGGNHLLRVVVVVLDIVLHVMIIIESGAGILQFVANNLGDSDIAWAPVVVAMGAICSFGVFYEILFKAGKLGERAKRRKVFKLRLQKKKEEAIRLGVDGRNPREKIVINL